MCNKNTTNLPNFFQLFTYMASDFFLPDNYCHYTSYLTCQFTPYIYAPILLIFHPFSKKTMDSTRCKQMPEVQWRRQKNCSQYRSRAGTGRFRSVPSHQSFSLSNRDQNELWCYRNETCCNRDVMETFLSVWTTLFNYIWESFTEQWCSVTERKHDG